METTNTSRGRGGLPELMTVPKILMTQFKGSRACAWLCSAALLAGAGIGATHAADLGPGPGPAFAQAVEIYGPVYGYFNPTLDPRCRIVPQPELSLYGDTARFRPTAVCQSRGLYTDSVLFP
jgi:hypothetical protein